MSRWNALGRNIFREISWSLFSKVSCPVYSLFCTCSHKSGMGCRVLAFFASLLLKFTKTVAMWLTARSVSVEIPAWEKMHFSLFNACYFNACYFFSNHTKLGRCIQISQYFLFYSNLDLEVTKETSINNKRCRGHAEGKRSSFSGDECSFIHCCKAMDGCAQTWEKWIRSLAIGATEIWYPRAIQLWSRDFVQLLDSHVMFCVSRSTYPSNRASAGPQRWFQESFTLPSLT